MCAKAKHIAVIALFAASNVPGAAARYCPELHCSCECAKEEMRERKNYETQKYKIATSCEQ